MRLQRLTPILLCAALAAGCASQRAWRHEQPPPDVPLMIQNDFSSALVVVVLTSRGNTRLGTVAALGSEELRVPGHIFATHPPYQFRVGLRVGTSSSLAYASSLMTVYDGESVVMEVRAPLRLTTVTVGRI
ncbi:MAG: hypothetical protein ACRELD_07355 [Longimicrobiales bacterium]